MVDQIVMSAETIGDNAWLEAHSMVDKTLSVTEDEIWADVQADFEADQPPPASEGWFTISDMAERMAITQGTARAFLERMETTKDYETITRKNTRYYRKVNK